MKDLRTIAGLCVVLAAAIAAGPVRAEVKTEWVDYRQGDTALRGYLAYDDAVKDRRPGVLLAHRLCWQVCRSQAEPSARSA